MKRSRGNWVDGDRFWGREADIEMMEEYIEEGANILLIAQRRMGKTSLMHEVGRRLADKYYCLHVDLQKAQTPADAVVELSIATNPHGSIFRRAVSVCSNILDKVADRLEAVKLDDVTLSIRGGLNSSNWQARGDQLFDVLAHSDRPVVVFFDEVPILVNRLLKGSDFKITPERRAEADEFMSWLRANAIRLQGRVRIVLTGSIGLSPLLRRAGLNATLNNFVAFELKEWSSETAIGCLRALAKEYGLTLDDGAPERVVALLDCCIPYHVQMFFDFLYQTAKLNGLRKIDIALVEKVYEESMLGIRGHAALSHMEERLRMMGDDLYPLSLELLTEAAVTGELTLEAARKISETAPIDERKNPDALGEVLDILEHDGYFKRDRQGAFKFQSNLLRQWWAAHFSHSYVPVSKRLHK